MLLPYSTWVLYKKSISNSKLSHPITVAMNAKVECSRSEIQVCLAKLYLGDVGDLGKERDNVRIAVGGTALSRRIPVAH